MDQPIESIVPEIWLHIAEWLDTKHFRKCVLVSKSWSTTFTPYLWRHFGLRHHSVAPTFTTVQKNAFSVRSLNTANLPRELLDVDFQHLQQLAIGPNLRKSQRDYDWDPIYGLLRRSASTLRSVTVVIMNGPFSSTFWDALQSCPMLERLVLDPCVIDLAAAPALLDVFCRLKTIRLSKIFLLKTKTASSDNNTLASNPFASEITLRKIQETNASKHFVPLSFGYPNLRRMELSCTVPYMPTMIPIPREIAILPRPYLSYIYLSNVAVSDVSMATLLDSIPLMVLKELYLFTTGLGPKALTSLHRHSQSVEHLHIRQCPAWTSQQFIRILTSFPRLLTVKAPYIWARDVAACPFPWVCTDLYKFCAYVDTSHSPTTKDALKASLEMERNERAMYAALGKLIKLRTLDISLVFGYHVAVSNGCHPLDLQLSSGMDALAELSELRVIDCRETNQVMGAQDIAWMKVHWPNLTRVRGEIVYADGAIEETLGSIGVELQEAEKVKLLLQVLLRAPADHHPDKLYLIDGNCNLSDNAESESAGMVFPANKTLDFYYEIRDGIVGNIVVREATDWDDEPNRVKVHRTWRASSTQLSDAMSDFVRLDEANSQVIAGLHLDFNSTKEKEEALKNNCVRADVEIVYPLGLPGTGRLKIEVTNGDIHVMFDKILKDQPPTFDTLILTTANGEIQLDNVLVISNTTLLSANGHVYGSLRTAGAVEAKVLNGPIDIAIDTGIIPGQTAWNPRKLDVKLDTLNGPVTLDVLPLFQGHFEMGAVVGRASITASDRIQYKKNTSNQVIGWVSVDGKEPLSKLPRIHLSSLNGNVKAKIGASSRN
ncbi:hypothetical protein BGZ82_007665 [Podila clonocystis]|nr:hypothetical protein BGZ82_007665 [Podila clonocystis]